MALSMDTGWNIYNSPNL